MNIWTKVKLARTLDSQEIYQCPVDLEQESRTLEINNVQDGTWHGRGDTICIGGFGEGSKAFFELHQPPLVSIMSPDPCNMQKSTDSSDCPST